MSTSCHGHLPYQPTMLSGPEELPQQLSGTGEGKIRTLPRKGLVDRPVSVQINQVGGDAGSIAQASSAVRRVARQTRSSEYQTHLPRRSSWTRPASRRTFR